MSNYEEHGTTRVIRFNWDILKKYTEGDSRKMLSYFHNVFITKADNFLYLNPWASKILVKSRGISQSFIGVDIKELKIAAQAATRDEVYVYIHLCSMRSYFSYLNTKGRVNYLPVWKLDSYDIEQLKMNRLLEVNEKNIRMLYEQLGE